MQFTIEYGEKRFRVVAPDGEYEEAVSYCAVSTVEYGGTVYGAYLNGEEGEIDPGPDEPNQLAPSENAKVYDLSNWPALVAVETVTENVDFEEDEEDGPVVDVQPVR